MLYRVSNTILRNDTKTSENDYASIIPPKNKPRRKIDVPDSFDGRVVWEGMLTPIFDQGSCGSCSSFGSVSCLADRFNIQSKGKMHVVLSAAKLALCNFHGGAFDVVHPEDLTYIPSLRSFSEKASTVTCENGNSLYDVWRYLYVIGTNTEECMPNSILLRTPIPTCDSLSGVIGDMCYDSVTPARFYRALHFYAVAGVPKDDGSEQNIRHNIFTWGPVTTGMIVYPDFYKFDPKKEIYSWNGEGDSTGGHAILILGWGEENGVKYWIIKNSWGTDWGDMGYFRMKRGTNECKIEENVVAGIPDFFLPFGSPEQIEYTWAEIENVKDQRRKIDYQIDISGGGISKRTGYIRRIEVEYPYLDFSPLIKESDLPDWSTFIAGKVSLSFYQRKKYLLFKISIFILFCIILGVLYLKRNKLKTIKI